MHLVQMLQLNQSRQWLRNKMFQINLNMLLAIPHWTFPFESVAKRARSNAISFCRNVATGTLFPWHIFAPYFKKYFCLTFDFWYSHTLLSEQIATVFDLLIMSIFKRCHSIANNIFFTLESKEIREQAAAWWKYKSLEAVGGSVWKK